MELVRSQDCGNSPKNQLAENLAIALLTSELETVSTLVTEDAQWNIVGGNFLSGQAAISTELEAMGNRPISKLTVLHAITHGKSGAVNGEVQYGDTAEGFCFIFGFANTKGTSVRQITSYHVTK